MGVRLREHNVSTSQEALTLIAKHLGSNSERFKTASNTDILQVIGLLPDRTITITPNNVQLMLPNGASIDESFTGDVSLLKVLDDYVNYGLCQSRLTDNCNGVLSRAAKSSSCVPCRGVSHKRHLAAENRGKRKALEELASRGFLPHSESQIKKRSKPTEPSSERLETSPMYIHVFKKTCCNSIILYILCSGRAF